MADIAQGNRAELILNPGDVYRVSTGGTATVEAVYGAPAGTTTITAATQDFGPYAANAKLIVRAVSGPASYSINQPIAITGRQNATGQTVLDDASRNALDVSGYGSLASRLAAAFNSAKNNNPLDLGVMSSPPTITVGAAAITNGQAVNYFDTDGYKKIRIKGVYPGDSSLMCQNLSGYFRGLNVANSGGNFTQSQNAKHYLAEVTFTGQVIQFVVNGLSAGLIRFRVNGALVSASTTNVGNSNVQLDFGATVYNKTIAMEFEQAQTIKGVVVGPNDTVHAVETPALPLVLVGDSYVQSVTSPVTIGSEAFPGCLRDVSGLNVIALGIQGAGYIKPGTVTLTNSQWLSYVISATNNSAAPVILIPFGTNDYGLDAAAVQSAVVSVGNSLLGSTSAKVIFMGPWPQNRNNDAGSLAIEAAIQAGAASLNQVRVGFIPVCSGNNPWVKGQGDNDTAPNGTSIAYGNSAIVTGNDGVHPYPGRGSEYLARKTIDSLIALCASKGW